MKKIVLILIVGFVLLSGCNQEPVQEDPPPVLEEELDGDEEILSEPEPEVIQQNDVEDEELIQSYWLEIFYDRGKISLTNVSVRNVEGPNYGGGPNQYSIEVLSDQNVLFHDFNFGLPIQGHFAPSPDWFDENGNQIYVPDTPQGFTLDELDYTLIIPYFPTGHWINLIDNYENELLLVVDISEFKQPVEILTYESSEIGIKINYPSDWKKIDNLGLPIVIFKYSKSKLYPVVSVNTINISEEFSFEEYAESKIESVKLLFPDAKLNSFPTTFQGKMTYQIDSNSTEGDVNYKTTEILIINNGRLYSIIYELTEDVQDEFFPIIQEIINSLEIL